jgi:hypothetical protein
MPDRRFPPPWTFEEANRACFIVRDGNNFPVAYVYFEEEPGRRAAARLAGAGEEPAMKKGYVVVPSSDTKCEIVPVDDPALLSAFASLLLEGYKSHENYWEAWAEKCRNDKPQPFAARAELTKVEHHRL